MDLKDWQVQVKFTFLKRRFSAKADVLGFPLFGYNNFYGEFY
jgi:hypothetical protein